MFVAFLRRLPQPVCLIAHNGLAYDFPLINAEMRRTGVSFPATVMCADSLEALRTLHDTIGRSQLPQQSHPNMMASTTDGTNVITQSTDCTQHGDKNVPAQHYNEHTPKREPLQMTLPSQLTHSSVDAEDSRSGACRQLFRASASAATPMVARPPEHRGGKLSFQLSRIYARIMRRSMKDAHNAEGDCIALLQIFHKQNKFLIDWVDQHCSAINTIPSMY